MYLILRVGYYDGLWHHAIKKVGSRKAGLARIKSKGFKTVDSVDELLREDEDSIGSMREMLVEYKVVKPQ